MLFLDIISIFHYQQHLTRVRVHQYYVPQRGKSNSENNYFHYSEKEMTLSATSITVNSFDDRVYWNAFLYNNNPFYIPAQFDEPSRQVPILDKPENYNLSVIRFSVPNSMRIFDFPQDGSFVVTLRYLGVLYQSTLTFTSAQQPSVFSIQQLLDSINRGLIQATEALLTAVPGTIAKAPFMIMDRGTGLFSLIADPLMHTNVVSVYFSIGLYQRIQGFNFQYFPTQTGYEILLIVEDTGNNEYIYPTGGFTYLQMSQDTPYNASIADYSQIVLTSNNLPIKPEQDAIGDSSTDITTKVITDFNIANATQLQPFNHNFDYAAQIYRKTTLLSSAPILNINFSIYLRLNTGVLEQMKIGPYEFLNVKILFLKKSLQS